MGARGLMMRNLCFLVLILVVVTMLCGCDINWDKPPFQYTSRQERSNIASIEICETEVYGVIDFDIEKSSPIAEITGMETDSFLDDLQALDCREYSIYIPPPNYRPVFIKITYLNGEIELIGLDAIGWISPEDDEMTITRYLFDYNDIRTLLQKYVDLQTLIDASQFFTLPYPTSNDMAE